MKYSISLKFSLVIGLSLLWSLWLLLANVCRADQRIQSQSDIVLGYGEPPSSYQGRWLQRVYTEAFRRLGYKLEYRYLPFNRVSSMADSGVLDGELSRSYDYGFFHPNLVRVKVPHHRDVLCALSTDSGIVLQGWQSLKGSNYLIDYLAGDQKTHSRLLPIMDASRLTQLVDTSSAMERLKKQRSNLFIISKRSVSEFMQKQSGQSNLVYEVGVMESISSHAYLHQRHLQIIPRLEKILQEMKNEGLLEQYWQLLLDKEEEVSHISSVGAGKN